MKKIKIFVILLFLFIAGMSFANVREIVLKDGQSFGDISFKKESKGKVFFKDRLLFDGVEGYDQTSPRYEIEEISVINLKTKFHLSACSRENDICYNFLVDKGNGNFVNSFGDKYSYPSFLTESNDGKYAVLYFRPEDAESEDEVNLGLIDTINPEKSFGKYLTNGLPQNFVIDKNYQFSFEDKSGIVKGDLLEFFKKEDIKPDVSQDTQTTNTKTEDSFYKYKNTLIVVAWLILIVLLIIFRKKI